MIRFRCPECRERVRVSDSFAGKKGRCPFCHNIYRIPTESEPETAGVADLAAALSGRLPVDGKTLLVFVTGGNVAFDRFAAILAQQD